LFVLALSLIYVGPPILAFMIAFPIMFVCDCIGGIIKPSSEND